MIEVTALTKTFGDVVAVRDLDLEIQRGEFLCLLGPSGCGKSTTLRIIAGFITPDRGRVLIDGTDVAGHGPDARPTAMVFQDYAIFPHLSVAENIEFGLRAQRVGRTERVRRVGTALELVGLEGLGERRPSELSGGQQQRVAVARSLAIEPSVLLMDEPLSNLDAKTRIQLRTQLRTIQRETGTTIVYVTHDQEEALALGDRIAVMKDGALEQLGSGEDIYQTPRTAYVADFVGVTNWLTAEAIGETSDGWTVSVGGAMLEVTPADGQRFPGAGAVLDVAVRPEDLHVTGSSGGDGQSLTGVVRDEQFLGPMVRTFVVVGTDTVMSHSSRGGWKPDDPVRLALRPEDVRAFVRPDGRSAGATEHAVAAAGAGVPAERPGS